MVVMAASSPAKNTLGDDVMSRIRQERYCAVQPRTTSARRGQFTRQRIICVSPQIHFDLRRQRDAQRPCGPGRCRLILAQPPPFLVGRLHLKYGRRKVTKTTTNKKHKKPPTNTQPQQATKEEHGPHAD